MCGSSSRSTHPGGAEDRRPRSLSCSSRPVVAAVALAVCGCLTSTPSAKASPPLVDPPGPILRVAGRNLLYGDQPVALFGQGDWLAVVKEGFDVDREADWYKPYLGRLTRVLLINTFVPDDAIPTYPWARGNDGRFDLRIFDESFWARFREFLSANEAAGRIVLLQLFDEAGLEGGSNRWDHHPFNPNLNVNALGLPGNGQDAVPEFYDLSNSRLMNLQQRYVVEVLRAVAEHGNVILEISNEYTGPSSWLQFWIDLVDRAQTLLGRNLLLTNMSCSQALLDFERASPGIDLLDLWHAPTTLRDLPLQEIHSRFVGLRSTGKPLLTGRIGPEPDLTDPSPANRILARKTFWTILMAGGAGATTKEDSSDDRIFYGPPLYDADTEWERMILGLNQFASQLIDPLGFAPHPERVESAPGTLWFAAASHAEIVVYLQGPGQGALRLTGIPDGSYTVRLYDPASARYLLAGPGQAAAGRITIDVPFFSDDLAVYVGARPLTVTALAPVARESDPVVLRLVFVDRNGTDRNGDGQTDLSGIMLLDSDLLFSLQPLARYSTIVRTPTTEEWTLPPIGLPAGVHEVRLRARNSSGAQANQVFRFVVSP